MSQTITVETQQPQGYPDCTAYQIEWIRSRSLDYYWVIKKRETYGIALVIFMLGPDGWIRCDWNDRDDNEETAAPGHYRLKDFAEAAKILVKWVTHSEVV